MKADPIRVGTDGSNGATSCLAKTFDELKILADLDVSKKAEEANKKVGEGVDCMTRSLDFFVRNARGQKPNSYSDQELAAFVERYLLKGEKLRADLLPVIFRFKSAWFGGDESSITKDEVARIRIQLLSLKHFVHRILPHLSILMVAAGDHTSSSENSETPSASVKDKLLPSEISRFEAAAEEFVAAVGELTESFAENGQAQIQISDLENLFSLFSRSKRWVRYVGAIGAVKQLLVRSPHTAFAPTDWPRFLVTAARLYTLGVRYQRYVKDVPFVQLEGPNLSQLEQILIQGLDLLETGLRNRTSSSQDADAVKSNALKSDADHYTLRQRIAPAELSVLFDEMAKAGLLAEKIRSESLKILIWPLMARLLRDPSHIQLPRGAPTGLGFSEIRILRSDLANWAAGHRMAVALTKKHSRQTVRETLRTLQEPRIELLGESDSPLFRAAHTPDTFATAAGLLRYEIQTLFSQGGVLTWDDQNRLRVEPPDEQQGVSRGDLVFFNAVRAIGRIVARGYSAESGRAQAGVGITELEMQELYLDVRSLGTDLELMDLRINNAGLRSFFEANLFMSVSNGDLLVSQREGIEFLASIVSGGRLAARVFQMAKAACAISETDFLGRPRLEPDCFREHLRVHFTEDFASLPGMSRFVSRLRADQEQWLQFIETLENAGRAAGFSDEAIEFNDLKVMTTIIQYVESLFVTFDTDRSEMLETHEVWNVFPSFKGFIQKLGQGWAETEFVQKTIFSYLMTFGQAPQMDLMGKLDLVGWSVRRHFQFEQADRLAVAKILASFKRVARQRGLNEIASWFLVRRDSLAGLLRSGDISTARELARLFFCPEDQVPNLATLVQAEVAALLAAPTPIERRRQACPGIKIYDPTCGLGASELTAAIFTERLARKLIRAPELSKFCQPTF